MKNGDAPGGGHLTDPCISRDGNPLVEPIGAGLILNGSESNPVQILRKEKGAQC